MLALKTMSSLSVLKKLAKKDDLVVIPRKEYEALLQLQKVKEFVPTAAQKKALITAENNYRKGKAFSYNELVKKLGFGN